MDKPLEKASRKVRPSKHPKIKKAFNAIVENEASAKPKSLGAVLRDVGYPETTSRRPTQVINSKTFQQLMDKAGITTDLLSNKLFEGLNSTKIAGKGDMVVPDYATRHRYLETALRLKGLQEGIIQNTGTVYNTQINQTNIDPNSTEAKQIIDNTLEILMKQTRAD